MKVMQIKEITILLLLSVSLFFSSINSLPVLDRDEARYVQASKQMVESNSYLSIKFQDEFRSKKPIGIYWLQTIPIKLLADITRVSEFKNIVLNDYIWKYRLISAFASLMSILLLYFLSNPLYKNNISFNASLILSCSLLVVVESHIAKTDSTLLLLSTISYLTFFKYYKGINKNKVLDFLVLWGSLGLSVLIKGPVLLILFIFSLIFLSIVKRDIKWIRVLMPLRGILLVIIVSVPWFFMLSYEEQKNFLQESLIHDFLGKTIRSQENHGAYPGFHSLGVLIFLFPFSIFIFPLFNYLKINYKNENILFLLSWILPCFLIMEFIPTKLPHYTLPVYPAIALAMSSALSNFKDNRSLFNTKIAYLGYIIYFVISNILISIILKLNLAYGEVTLSDKICYLTLFLLNNIVFIFIFKKAIRYTFYYLVLYSNIFTLIVYLIILPSLDKLWVSKNIANILHKDSYNENKNSIAVLGYNEPSLIFEVGTNTKIYYDTQSLVGNFKFYDYLIIEKDYYMKFNKFVKKNNLSYNLLSKFKGFNGAKGKWVEIYILKKKL